MTAVWCIVVVLAFCSGYWFGHQMRYEQQIIDAELARHEAMWAEYRDAEVRRLTGDDEG